MAEMRIRLSRICLWLMLIVPLTAAGQQAPPSQTAGPPPEIPTFRAESRQVIVEAEVWNHVGKRSAGDESPAPPISVMGPPNYGVLGLNNIEGLRLPPPAAGLTPKDFQVLDNGVEQRVNYLQEADFPAVWGLTTTWRLSATSSGVWGFPHLPMYGYPYAHSTAYLIGYVPLPLQPGECRTIQIVVPDHYVQVNRKQYCALNGSKAPEETELDARMLHFASTTSLGKIHVAVGAFAFWSSTVLSLTGQTPTAGAASQLPATAFTFVVNVHDSKAPATVQIATQILLPNEMWKSPCPKNAAIHLLGTVLRINGEIERQFTDLYRCGAEDADDPLAPRFAKIAVGYMIPSLYDTQIDLRPGEYKVRVLVTDGKDFGRAYATLRVEPLNAQGLTVSDVLLDSILRDASLIVRDAAQITPDPLIPAPLVSKMVMPGPVAEAPALVQEVQFLPFPYALIVRGNPLSVYFEIYKPAPDASDAAIHYRVRITDLETDATVMNTEPTSAADYVIPGSSVVPIGLKLDTNNLRPGLYRLEVQASDSAGHKSEWKQASFVIK